VETTTAKSSYVVRRPGIRIVYELYDDEVQVSQDALLGTHYRVAYKLTDLDPSAFETRSRDQWITALVGLIAIGGVVPFMLLVVRHLPLDPATKGTMFLGWLFGGALFSLVHPFRVHSIAYRLRSGAAALYLPKMGRYRDQRDAFADQLVHAVKACAPPAPPR
jgi:hypothetical protein